MNTQTQKTPQPDFGSGCSVVIVLECKKAMVTDEE